MPPSKHAVLSASGAHRWLHCNPSARLELEFADRETESRGRRNRRPCSRRAQAQKGVEDSFPETSQPV